MDNRQSERESHIYQNNRVVRYGLVRDNGKNVSKACVVARHIFDVQGAHCYHI
jgi:hypothetical protein